ncbi:MAG: VOC family protein [Micrococcaceae bacterium]
MQKIIPSLWCIENAREMAEFYTSTFPNSSIIGGSKYPTEGLLDFQKDFVGKDLTLEIKLMSYQLTLINASDEFKPNVSTSMMVILKDKEQLSKIYQQLLNKGTAVMPLGQYPFCELYGWVADQYGYSWQLVLGAEEDEERMYPSLSFGGNVRGKAAEAAKFYMDTFENSELLFEYKNPQDENLLQIGEISLDGQSLALDDAEEERAETFNEAFSLQVFCKDQDEIDHLWEKLSSNPKAEQCGWCQDQFGVAWQVLPAEQEELMKKPGAFETMMHQKKIIISEY